MLAMRLESSGELPLAVEVTAYFEKAENTQKRVRTLLTPEHIKCNHYAVIELVEELHSTRRAIAEKFGEELERLRKRRQEGLRLKLTMRTAKLRELWVKL
ncbi:MAG: hypothetical protein ABIP85_17470 [Chthoniobacteraceae bacterium]